MIKKIPIYLLIILLTLLTIYVSKLIFFKPFSFNHFLTRQFVFNTLDSPESLTYIGLLEKYGYRSYNGKLSDYSLEKDKDDLKKLRKEYKILNSYQDKELSPDELLSKKIAQFQMKNEIEQMTKYPYHAYPLIQMNGLHTRIIEFMTDIHPIKDEKDGEYYLSRLAEIPNVFAQILEKMEKRKESKIFPPTFMVERVIDQIENIINIPIEANPLMTIFTEKLSLIGIEQKKIDLFEDKAKKIITEEIIPSYHLLLMHLHEIKPLANTNHGVWSLPDGDNYYSLRLKIMTTSDYSAETIHNIGLSEVERITNEIKDILKAEGYENIDDVGQVLVKLNESDKFLFKDDQNSRKEIIDIYNNIINEAYDLVPQYFRKLPKSKVIVRPVPTYSEKSAAGGYYRGPSLDGKRPGIFYANLYDIKATPKFGMKTLAFHEAIPGHHFQIALNQENNDLGIYRKYAVNSTAYSEGWALYAEQLAVEIGLAENPYDKIGFLQSDLFRAVRLVVDTGIHHKRWSREKAINYMYRKTGKAMSSVVAEIERYIAWPGQACSYKIGMLKILELRQNARETLGIRFDIRDFHDFILENGEVPLTVLEDNYKEWIKKKS